MNKNIIDFDLIRKENKFIDELNFTNDEIIQNYLKIIDINKNLDECNKSQYSYCINESNMHEEFYRDNFGVLKIRYINCSKNNREISCLNNYLIHDYDHKIFSLATSKEKDIIFFKDKKEFYKF